MAAAPSSLWEQIHEELSCSICLELFTRPKVLPCQHTFCQDCLEKHARRGGTFKCPNCRRRVKMPAQGVAGLQDNHLVKSLCDRISNQLAVSTESEMTVCQRLKEQQTGNKCDNHPSEELKVYCKQCLVPVCDKCSGQAHAGHTTISLKKAVEESSRAALETSVDKGKKVLESYLSFLRDLRDKEKEATERKEQTDKEIAQVFDQKVQQLERNMEMLLDEVEEEHGEVLEMIQKRRDEVLEDVAELSAACESAGKAISGRKSKFLGHETSLIWELGKHIRKKAPTPVQIEHTVFVPNDEAPTVGNIPNLEARKYNLLVFVIFIIGVYGLYRYGGFLQGGFLQGCVCTILSLWFCNIVWFM